MDCGDVDRPEEGVAVQLLRAMVERFDVTPELALHLVRLEGRLIALEKKLADADGDNFA